MVGANLASTHPMTKPPGIHYHLDTDPPAKRRRGEMALRARFSTDPALRRLAWLQMNVDAEASAARISALEIALGRGLPGGGPMAGMRPREKAAIRFYLLLRLKRGVHRKGLGMESDGELCAYACSRAGIGELRAKDRAPKFIRSLCERLEDSDQAVARELWPYGGWSRKVPQKSQV